MQARGVRRILPAVVAIACALMVLVVVTAHHARADEPPFFAIKNARIVPVSGPPISSGTIVVSHGVIQAVGANVAVPPEARVIDGSGMTVYPGLIDAGTDVGLGVAAAPAGGGGRGGGGGGGGRGAGATNLPLSMGPEDRPATTPWENAADVLHSDDSRIETWRNAGFTTALVIPRNGYFPGQAAVVDLGTADREEGLVVKTPAALPINLQGGRGEYQGFPSALMGQLSYVRQVFIDAQWYAQAMQAYDAHPQGRERPAYDHTDVVIGHVLANKELVIWPAETDTQILRALRLAPTLGARWALSGAQQGYEVANEIAAANVPVFINVNWPVPAAGGGGGSGRGGGGGRGGEEGDTLRTLRFRDRAPSTPALLNKAGVKIAFMSGGVANPKDTLRNVAKSIVAGLPADAALRALTLGAAEILGVSDRLGSIEPGKIANLVVTDGDIFADRTTVKYVFVDGKFYIPPPVVEPPAGGGRGGRGGGEPGNADMTGAWTLTFTTEQGTDTATANLQMAQDGSLSGSVISHMGTGQLTRGRLTGNNFQFSIVMQINGADTQVDFRGTVTGNQLAGTIDVSGYSMEFTGRKPNAAGEEVRQ
jgi:imidazolonepropionase-like amidohydrolase